MNNNENFEDDFCGSSSYIGFTDYTNSSSVSFVANVVLPIQMPDNRPNINTLLAAMDARNVDGLEEFDNADELFEDLEN